jgi:xanthine dehydrogenase accessory factor
MQNYILREKIKGKKLFYMRGHLGQFVIVIPQDDLIIVRGGGDLATGTIHRLWAAGLRVLVLEIENPAAIRRQVALCEAVYTKTTEVEGLRAVRIDRYEEAEAVWQENSVPILIDPKGVSIGALKPAVVIDAILAKRNLGTRRDMAPLTIALGPGFTAGEDVDVVVETKRGHRLGRIIREGAAIPNTGIPGVIGGYGAERVIHAQAAGIFKNVRVIGDIVEAGDTIAEIWQEDGTKLLVQTQITGILRGLLRDGYRVTEHFKVADVDPRKEELSNCFLISDKARCIAGSVLELVCAQLWK